MADLAPMYDYRRKPLSPMNRRAAKALGWRYDTEWLDHKDGDGFLVHGPYHERPDEPIDPAALK